MKKISLVFSFCCPVQNSSETVYYCSRFYHWHFYFDYFDLYESVCTEVYEPLKLSVESRRFLNPTPTRHHHHSPQLQNHLPFPHSLHFLPHHLLNLNHLHFILHSPMNLSPTLLLMNPTLLHHQIPPMKDQPRQSHLLHFLPLLTLNFQNPPAHSPNP